MHDIVGMFDGQEPIHNSRHCRWICDTTIANDCTSSRTSTTMHSCQHASAIAACKAGPPRRAPVTVTLTRNRHGPQSVEVSDEAQATESGEQPPGLGF